MKFTGLILSALFLTACLAANALAIEDAGSMTLEEGESLADKLIDASNGPGILKSSSGLPPNPDASKQAWANRTGVNFTMPKSLSETGKNAKDSRADAQESNSQQTEDTAAQSPAEDTAGTESESTSAEESVSASPEDSSVGGTWSFTLDESTPKEMVLTLFQSGNEIYGTGSINTGEDTLAVAASGSVDGESMVLDVTSIGTISVYKMALNLDGDSASGNYEAFAASGETWNGNAQGIRSVPQ